MPRASAQVFCITEKKHHCTCPKSQIKCSITEKNIIAHAQSLRSSVVSQEKNIIAIAQSIRSSVVSQKKYHRINYRQLNDT